MTRKPDDPRGEWEELWQKIIGNRDSNDIAERLKKGRVIWIAAGIIAAIWLLTGIYTVGPGEEGVVRRFGNHVGTTDPGLSYHMPWPFERVDRVNMEEIRTAEVGFRTIGTDQTRTVKQESQMLTGDENIVDAQIIVQYKVVDSSDYLFNVKEPAAVVHAATEVALRSVVGRNTIDFVIIEGRSIVQDEAMSFLQRLLDAYDSGLIITAVKLQYAGPPEEVKDAFDEVVRAREDKQRLIREAEGYAADRVPKARGEGEQAILTAEAYKEQRVLEAEGDAARFLKILREHEVPAAFQALAAAGNLDASAVLSRVGFVELTPLAAFAGTATAELTAETVASGTAAAGLDAEEQDPQSEAEPAASAEDDVEPPGLTRETLAAILANLGVFSADRSPNELTSGVLYDALARLGVADTYEEAYREAIRLTRERLYLETMDEVLSGTEKFIVDPDTGGNLVPFLPLKELTGSQQPKEAGQ